MGVEGTSYGGQLTDWLITQTNSFKAAIPTAGISNLVSFNYMSYYHDYLAVEFGSVSRPKSASDGRAVEARSALRYANQVKTPTMFCTARTTTTCRSPRPSSSTSRSRTWA